MLFESRGLPRDSICFLEAEPGKLDIKRRRPCILFTFNRFTLQNSDYDVIIAFRADTTSLTTLLKNVQRHDDLINAHVVR